MNNVVDLDWKTSHVYVSCLVSKDLQQRISALKRWTSRPGPQETIVRACKTLQSSEQRDTNFLHAASNLRHAPMAGVAVSQEIFQPRKYCRQQHFFLAAAQEFLLL